MPQPVCHKVTISILCLLLLAVSVFGITADSTTLIVLEDSNVNITFNAQYDFDQIIVYNDTAQFDTTNLTPLAGTLNATMTSWTATNKSIVWQANTTHTVDLPYAVAAYWQQDGGITYVSDGTANFVVPNATTTETSILTTCPSGHTDCQQRYSGGANPGSANPVPRTTNASTTPNETITYPPPSPAGPDQPSARHAVSLNAWQVGLLTAGSIAIVGAAVLLLTPKKKTRYGGRALRG